jgi:hypothetical protein
MIPCQFGTASMNNYFVVYAPIADAVAPTKPEYLNTHTHKMQESASQSWNLHRNKRPQPKFRLESAVR